MATALAALALLLAGCGDGGDAAAGANGDELDVAAYSAFEIAYRDTVEPAFAKTFEGERDSIGNSFGPSDEQSRAVAEGAPASVVRFSRGDRLGREDRGRTRRRHRRLKRTRCPTVTRAKGKAPRGDRTEQRSGGCRKNHQLAPENILAHSGRLLQFF